MQWLTGDEFKVLTVVLRKTFGWQKASAPIAESEVARITGLSRVTAGKVCKRLIDFGLIVLLAKNNPKTNLGNVYKPQMDSDKVDAFKLLMRHYESAQTGEAKMGKARSKRTPANGIDPANAITPPHPNAISTPPVNGISTENPIETQSKPKGAKTADAASPAGVTYEAKDIGNMTTTNKTFVDVQMDWIEKNDENVRRLRTHAKSETALAASLEFYRVSGIKVLPHGAKNRLAGGQALYEASGGNLTLIEKAYNQLKSSNAWVTDEWSLVKTVNVLASEAPTPANTGASLVEWVTTPAGKILRYDGVPYPGDAGRQKCVELGIAYEGN